MGDSPASDTPKAAGEVVRHDLGGWISGPSLSVEPVEAVQVLAGDVLLIDGADARVTARRFGEYWIRGTLARGIAIDWNAKDGTARGTLFRRPDDVVLRLRQDTENRPAN